MELDLTRIFVKVVQFNSFSKAAVNLKMPKSTVSKAISRLEKETGTKLLVRSTRSLTLTLAGRTFYDSSLGPIHLLEDAQKALYGTDTQLTGIVRITAPEDLGTSVVAPAVAKISVQHPLLRFELLYIVRDPAERAERINYYATISKLSHGMIDEAVPAKDVLTMSGDVIIKPGADAAFIQGAYSLEM